MLVLKNISKTFGAIKALDNVNFCLKSGEVVTLFGANGAGKSTLMRVVCGVLDADKGDALVFGNNIKSQRIKALQCIGYMPENNPIYFDLSVEEFLVYMAKLKKAPLTEVNEVVEMFSLKEVYLQKIETLSKGYKTRVAIAATILSKPKVLILDEPTEGLDPNQKQSLRNVLKEYAKKNIVLISTHIIEEAEELNSRILVLNKGKLIRDTSTQELKEQNKQKSLGASLRAIMEDEK